jgi:CBS domain-containing protein
VNVKDIMTRSVKACRPDDTLETAARLMWENDCGALPVVDREGHPQAMLTDRDICMAAYMRGKPLAALRVDGSMSATLSVCHGEDSLAAVTSRMAQQQVRRIPVVDKVGKLVGMLSLNDIALAVRDKTPARLDDEAGAGTLRVLQSVCAHRGPIAHPPVAKPAARPAASEAAMGG